MVRRRYDIMLNRGMFLSTFLTSLWCGMTFSMKIFCVFWDIPTKLTEFEFVIVLHIVTKVGSNRTTISYSCHRNDRSKSMLSMKGCVISWDISTNRTGCISGNVLYIPTKFGSNRITIQYSCYRNDRLKMHL